MAAGRGAAILGGGEPTAAAQDAPNAGRRAVGVGGGFRGVGAIAVLHPLPDAAVHGVHAPGVRLLLAHRVGDVAGIGGVPGIVVELGRVSAEGVGRGGTGARRVFPLGLRGQTIRCARLRGVQLGNERLRVLPGDALDRPVGIVGELAGVALHHREPLRLRHLEPPDIKRLVEGHQAHGLLVGIATFRSHLERAGRDQHKRHVQVVGPGLRRPGIGGRSGGRGSGQGGDFFPHRAQLLGDGFDLPGEFGQALGGCLLPGHRRKHLVFKLSQPSGLRLLTANGRLHLVLQRRETLIHVLLKGLQGGLRRLNPLHRGVHLLHHLSQALRDLLLFRNGRAQLVLQAHQVLGGIPNAHRAALALPADVEQAGGQHDDHCPLPAALGCLLCHCCSCCPRSPRSGAGRTIVSAATPAPAGRGSTGPAGRRYARCRASAPRRSPPWP